MYVSRCVMLYTFMIIFFLKLRLPSISLFFFFNDTATTEIYTLSLHDALPISIDSGDPSQRRSNIANPLFPHAGRANRDRKSTRLNSSHGYISYAVFCLKKKKITYIILRHL